MIQRIQTIYFLLAIVTAAFPLFGGKLFSIVLENGEIIYTVFSVNLLDGNSENMVLFYGPVIILTLTLLVTLLSFKNRKRQIYLGILSIFLSLSISFWMIFFVYLSAGKLASKYELSINPQLSYVIFSITFFFIFMGVRGVRKDKKLIDSVNRIR